MNILSIKVDENKLNNELRVERLLLESQLKSLTDESAPDNKAIMQEIKMRLWIINGTLCKGLSFMALLEVYLCCKRIGMVPQDYNFPSL